MSCFIYLYIHGLIFDQVQVILKDCIHGRKGAMAAEVKAVVSFQDTPPGTSPHVALCGLPRTINNSIDYAERVIQFSYLAAKSNGNVAAFKCFS